LVAERFVGLGRLYVSTVGGIRSEYTGISSQKQCFLITVAANLRFLIQYLIESNILL